MSLSTREKCRRLVTSGVTPAEAATRYGVRPGTVRQWANRGRWQHRKEVESVTQTVPQAIPKAPEWMQSISHQNAHLVTEQGRAVCDERITGIIGVHWHPHDFVKPCTRCQGWESRNVIKGQESSFQNA